MTTPAPDADSSTPAAPSSDVIYRLEDRPPLPQTLLAALQHVLAVFVGIITPPLIIGRALGLSLGDASYVVSMSLMVSGLATAIQARRLGPVGSGLLSVQGTSFVFLAPIIAAGKAAKQAAGGGAAGARHALAVIFCLCGAGSVVEIGLSRALRHAQRVVPPLVSGVVVTLIGLTLIKVGFVTMCGGPAARASGTFGSPLNLGLALLVLAVVIVLNRSKHNVLRMGAIAFGLVAGYGVAVALGLVDFSKLAGLARVAVPQPLRYGFGWDWASFAPIALIYAVTAIESIGDLTATSSVSDEPIAGDLYTARIQGGVLGDGVNSLLAALLNTFPNTTFSQNNGVIQLTGVASRYVGYFIALMLALLGLFPVVGGLFQIMPPAVLGGATLIMFGAVAAAGVRIIASEPIDRRAMLILAVSLALGLGVTFVPDSLSKLPALAREMLHSGVATGGLAAIVLNLALPRERVASEGDGDGGGESGG